MVHLARPFAPSELADVAAAKRWKGISGPASGRFLHGDRSAGACEVFRRRKEDFSLE
jgi:hypothetical protein